MFVSHKDLNVRNLTMECFRRGEETNQQRLVEEEARSGTEMEITAYGTPLYQLNFFN